MTIIFHVFKHEKHRFSQYEFEHLFNVFIGISLSIDNRWKMRKICQIMEK